MVICTSYFVFHCVKTKLDCMSDMFTYEMIRFVTV